MVKCLPEFEYFTVFLKNRNFISKIRRSKVTVYAALMCDTYTYRYSMIQETVNKTPQRNEMLV